MIKETKSASPTPPPRAAASATTTPPASNSPLPAGEGFTSVGNLGNSPISRAHAAINMARQQALYGAFSNGLLLYHRVDGRKDGSTLRGVQYPPIPSVSEGNEASLKAFIHDLSAYLAAQPGIRCQAPAADEDRDEFRTAIAAKALPGIQKHARQEFDKTVASIQDPELKAFVQKVVEHAPPQFFLAPSSSSGKYHPADEINQGGLVVHTIRDVQMGRMLAKYFNLSQKETDEISAALLLHDIEKGGIPWRGKAPNYGYDTAHGPLASHWLEQFEDPNSPEEKIVDQEVRAHMAQWNRPLPTPPKTLGEQIVSYADYLASLDDVYVSWR